MREIKFRGKRIDNGKWIYGYYAKADEGEEGIRHVIQAANGYEYVNGDTVGEYTGLKDKNGKEIYEGDIIKYNFKSLLGDKNINRDRIAPVFWQEFRAVWAVADGKNCNSDLYKYVQNGNVVEVVGNIYENSELLK